MFAQGWLRGMTKEKQGSTKEAGDRVETFTLLRAARRNVRLFINNGVTPKRARLACAGRFRLLNQ